MINLMGDHSTGILECLDISITITFKYRPLPFYLLVNRKPEPVKLFHSNISPIEHQNMEEQEWITAAASSTK